MPSYAEPIVVVDDGLDNSSYVVDLGDRRALVLDPGRDPGLYLATAERRGLTIAYSAETHLHADFVSGSRELAAGGAQVLAAAAGGIEFPHHGLSDGDEVDLGGLTLRALATPGHTPEHLSYLLLDSDRPKALFSGGSLLVGAVARPDLIAPERTEELARELWRSLHDRILTLPDDLAVYPAHGAGSFCSALAGTERTTTIGAEKAVNPLLAAPDEDAFVAMLLGGLGSYPPYFLRLREVNRRGPAAYGRRPPALEALSVDRLRRLVADGAQLVDARPIAAFAAGHIPGALSIELRPAFASWLGWLVSDDRPIVFVVDPDQDREDVVRQSLKVGYERLAGELDGGMKAWEDAGLPTWRVGVVPASQLHGHVLDVRQTSEFAAGHVPRARHVELGNVPAAAADLDGEGLSIMCGHGEPAMTAASLLEAAGRSGLTVAVGGPDEWAAMNHRSLDSGR
jgi:glyoxylase-like metal-dependent hydrolase (beta-lactamase superfamily II)/rhodanese-related sulfurtransferase